MTSPCLSRLYSYCYGVNLIFIRSYKSRVHRFPLKVFENEESMKQGVSMRSANENKRNAYSPNILFSKKRGDKKQESITFEVPESSIQNQAVKVEPNPIVKNEGTSSKSPIVYADGVSLKECIITERLTSERKLSALMQTVKSSKARKVSGNILLEGERLINDALKSGATAEALFISRKEMLQSLQIDNNAVKSLYQINYNQIKLWSELSTSPGILGIFDVKSIINNKLPNNPSGFPLTVLCDNIRDPGNLGALLRTAAAVGCKHFITTKGCTDAWDPKVLRSAAGAHFRINMSLGVEWDAVCNFIPKEASVVLADSSIDESKEKVLSNEDLEKMLRKIEEQNLGSPTVEVANDGEVFYRDPSYCNETVLKIYRNLPLPRLAYTDLKIRSSDNIFLVIGGETHGISSAALKLAHDYGGSKVHIPLENGVESLNAGLAFSVLAYEIKRKFMEEAKINHS